MNINYLDTKNFALNSDWLNTINGGVVNTYVEIIQNKENVIINVNAPSIRPDSYQIVFNNNKLFVYALHNFQELEITNENIFTKTLFNRVFDVPPFVDSQKIKAEIIDDKLKIFLPLKDKNEIVPRKIEIRNN